MPISLLNANVCIPSLGLEFLKYVCTCIKVYLYVCKREFLYQFNFPPQYELLLTEGTLLRCFLLRRGFLEGNSLTSDWL